MYKLNKTKFSVIENGAGLSAQDTVFEYQEIENVIQGKYKGGGILSGSVIGKRISEREVYLYFQCVTDTLELRSGESRGILSRSNEELIEIDFKWRWFDTEEWFPSKHKELPQK
ncbi:hypothetical protein E1176_10505 [Fulvivirga sp. RKSG066]|uniref:hypothetical protein n=1 Tax=Fulvivirga aurantia TaxID=2529383 RepID=UPI0012BD817A|nr:hypothetical protein [Fulvivirga aurantia]MTI21448.1 hypothetical protein [Fulvivirga aurantia]